MITDFNSYAKKGLQAELARLDAERERVRALLASLDGATGKAPVEKRSTGTRRPRQMSEAGRQAIREAVKRRWARVRAETAASTPSTASEGEADHARGAVRPKAQKRTRKASRAGSRKK